MLLMSIPSNDEQAYRCESPVVMFVFNRPSLAARVLAAVRRVRPARLFFIADGPRGGVEADQDACHECLELAKSVDWPCDVVISAASTNLGLARRVSSGLTDVFAREDRAIILEDDCVPCIDFFRFCDALLHHYALDNRVGMISGDNFQLGRHEISDSYYFSRFTHIWGWATWRRAWKEFDPNIELWPEFKRRDFLRAAVTSPRQHRYWAAIFDRNFADPSLSWAYPWTFASWANNFLSVVPAVNLVSNVGFGSTASNTRRPNRFASLPTEAMEFPLRHPRVIAADTVADARTADEMFFAGSLVARVVRKVLRY